MQYVCNQDREYLDLVNEVISIPEITKTVIIKNITIQDRDFVFHEIPLNVEIELNTYKESEVGVAIPKREEISLDDTYVIMWRKFPANNNEDIFRELNITTLTNFQIILSGTYQLHILSLEYVTKL